MDEKVYDIFDKIHADDELKEKTANYLCAEIRKRQQQRKPAWRMPAVACASLAVFLLCGFFSFKIYFTPVAYIDIDVNPSVGFSVNRFGRVIRYNAYNDDGTAMINKLNVNNADYSNAFERLLDAMNADGHFTQNGAVYVTVQTNENDREKRILRILQETLADSVSRHHYNISADIFTVTEAVKLSADKNHISPAKYLAIQELLETGTDANFEECAKHTVHELRQLAQEHDAIFSNDSDASDDASLDKDSALDDSALSNDDGYQEHDGHGSFSEYEAPAVPPDYGEHGSSHSHSGDD